MRKLKHPKRRKMLSELLDNEKRTPIIRMNRRRKNK
jgi:hypothetical protein